MDAKGKTKWARCLAIIKENVDQADYRAWYDPVEFVGYDPNAQSLVLGVPSYAICEKLDSEKKLKHLLYNVVWRTYGKGTSITYRVLVDSTTSTTADVPSARGTVSSKPADDLDSQLNEGYTFDTYVEGEGNRLLRSVGMSIAENPKQMTFNPLFVYGASGVGKTHLVNAIGVEYKRRQPGKRVLYVTANQFKVQYMGAKQENKINDFIYFYQGIDLLIVDDIQEFASLSGTQQTFFHIFNHLKMNNRLIVMTSDRAPHSMPGMEERLLTRFKWGLSEELKRPDYDLCRRILNSKISLNGLTVAPDVVDYIAQNAQDSIRDLEGILNSLMAHALFFGREIDMDICRQVVGKAMQTHTRTVTVEMILARTCEYFGVPEEEITAKGRKATVALVRQLIMYLACRHTRLTTARIGAALGGRNHATVIHGTRQTTARLSADPAFAAKVAEIESLLN